MGDQADSLRRQFGHLPEINQAKTIAVVSGKGGVGKSNFALNFSLSLLNRGKKVLLVDLDVGMGNIDILLGLNAPSTIIDMLNKDLSIHDIIETGPNQLAYISGGTGISQFFSLDEQKKEFFYQQYRTLLVDYDYIIFDMGAGATDDSLFFILAADECIVITTPEPTSITDAYSMIKHIVNKDQNLPIYVVMNRCMSKKIGQKALDQFQQIIARFLTIEINKMGILPDDKIVSLAVMRQTPYLLLNRRAPISQAMRQLTINYLTKGDEQLTKKPFSFVNKLKQFMRER